MISNVCAQVDQDDVTRKCERVYVRRMNILITAIEERVTPAPVLTLDTGTGRHRRGWAGSRCPECPGLTISHPGVGNWKHFLGKQKQGPGEYRGIDGAVWVGPTDALIDHTQKLKLTILLYIGDQYDFARLKVL